MKNPRHFTLSKKVRIWDGQYWWTVKDNDADTLEDQATKPSDEYVDISPEDFNKRFDLEFGWVGEGAAPPEWEAEKVRLEEEWDEDDEES